MSIGRNIGWMQPQDGDDYLTRTDDDILDEADRARDEMKDREWEEEVGS